MSRVFTFSWGQDSHAEAQHLSFWPAVALAAALSLAVWLLEQSFGWSLIGWRLGWALVHCVYVLALVRRRGHHSGSRAVLAGLIGAQVVLWWCPYPMLYLVGQALLLSVLRSALFRQRWWALGQDLLLAVAAICVLLYLLKHGASVSLALWAYLLVQALSALIATPARSTSPTAANAADLSAADSSQQRFQQARERAQSAWERYQHSLH